MATQLAPGWTVLAADPIPPSHISAPRPGGIPRPTLVARVEAGMQGKLTAISAPGGWGKTTLLAQWVASTRIPVAWICLEGGDNDPTRFFRSLGAALDRIQPLEVGRGFSTPRAPEQALPGQIHGVLLARLADIPRETAIVLDDLHHITNPDLIQSLRQVLEQLPQNIHLVVSTRGELPFPVARLRSSGELTLIRATDLAFSTGEASAMIADVAGVRPPDADIALLVERTEGWIAGLRLAGLSMAGTRDARQVIERFRGTHRDVADYFREEVLTCLDHDLRSFLLESALPDKFCSGLLDAMTGRTDSQAMIERVADANLFLVALDDERQWYRYHALFREMLLAEARQLPAERIDSLHRRASAWFEGAVMVREAVSHALATGDHERVAALVDQYAHILLYVCGETNQLVSWIDELGVEALRKRPRLLWAQAWALTTTGRVVQAQDLLDRYERAGPDPATSHDDQEEALLLAVRSRLAAYRGDNRAAIVLGERALALLDTARNTRTHGDVVLSMGFAHRALGHTHEAAAHFAEAARLGRQHGNVQAARWGVRYLAVTRMSEGRLNEAEAIIDEDLERVRRESADPGSILSALLVGKAEILYQRNRLAEAHAALDQAFPLIQGAGDAKMLSNAYAAMGRVLQAEGHHLHAREKIRRSEDVFTMLMPGANVAMMALWQGDLAGAERWARRSGFSLDDEPDASRGEFEQETFARIMLAVEPSPASFGLIDRLIADSDASERFGRSLELHLARAEAAWRCGRPAEARSSVLQALRSARDEGFIRPFLHHGAPMQAILRDLVRERDLLDAPSRAFALSVIAAAISDATATTGTDVLIEPLTERQSEILRLLADGQSNRDIADQLSIAEGTVKAHMHQLFGKLAARNRTEAVANARQLHLLG